MFAQDEGFASLGKCLADGDLRNAFDVAQTLKGVAGNLGLTPMFNTISDIVEPLRAGTDKDTAENYKKLLDELEFFKKCI